MRKTFNVKPINEIELVFQGGYKLILRFDTLATYHMTTEFDLQDLMDNPSITEICAMVIYSGSVENNKDMTVEKARELVCQMDLETIMAIVKEFEASMGVADKEIQKKTMEDFIRTLSLKRQKR